MNFQEKIEIYKDIIVSLDYCVNDYLYILDVENDEYFISPHAAVRFKMDNAYFKNPVKEFKKFVYYKDYDLVVEDLNKILSGEKTYHNMQYRWLNDESLPVWINCRGQAIIENHQVKYLIGCINEIGGRQKADNISGLLGETSLEQYIVRKTSEGVALDGFFLRVGIDGLKGINARLGMEYGDLLLCRTAEYIQCCLRPEEQLYHMSGDEFLIVNLAGGTEKDAREQYKKIQEKIEQFIEKKNYQVVYTVSAGLLPCSDIREFEIANLLKLTEFTLNQADRRSRTPY